VKFRTKPQIALEQIQRALGNGIRVSFWMFDALYGRDGAFLDALEALGQTAFSAQAVVMRRCRADGERSRANAPTGVLPASCSGSAGAFDFAVRCSTRTMDRSQLHRLAESE
jgi:hypothetical protein